MSFSSASNHLAIIATVAGVVSAGMNTGIEDLLDILINKETLKIRETLAKSLIAGFTTGLILSVIYYAFALYGFAESPLTPIQLVFLFALFVGLGNPLLGAALKSFYSRLAKN